MLVRRSRVAAPSRAALLVSILAAIGLVSSGVAVANGQHGVAAPNKGKEPSNLSALKDQVRAYYGDIVDSTQPAGFTHQASPTSAYAKEVRGIERTAKHYLWAQRHVNKPAIVLDVDDTSVLTYEMGANGDFGFVPAGIVTYGVHGFPQVYGMPDLVNWAHRRGYAVFWITGRPDVFHTATLANLQGHELNHGKAYPVVTSGSLSPQGDNVFTQPADAATRPYLHCSGDGVPACSTVEYKSGTRAYIISRGYTIVANFGDQDSDLKGGFANHRIKLPNPMYFLP